MQPALNREGYAIFVRCCDLSSNMPVGEFVSIIKTLDRILFGHIGGGEDFFRSPYGGAIYRGRIEEALEAARALVSELGEAGISAALGMAWGSFQRTVNVQDWNAAALPLNEAARLAFCDAAKGRVLVTPQVKETAGARVKFSEERRCEVKGASYAYRAIASPDYEQRLAARDPAAGTVEACEKDIVLWDVVKYSARHPDEQAELSHGLALIATTVLHEVNAGQEDYSPSGDGGFALFDTGLRASFFARRLGRYAASKGITVRIGIGHGEVANTTRGWVGPGVLRADSISAQAPANGVAMPAEVWRTLDRISQEDWRAVAAAPETAADTLRFEPSPGVVQANDAVRTAPTSYMKLATADRSILVEALSDIPQFLTALERKTFMRMVLSNYPGGDEVNKTLRILDWEGGALVVAYNLVLLLEAQEVAPGVPALRAIAEAIEPIAGTDHREGLAGLRRRL